MRLPFQLLSLAAAILAPLTEASSNIRNPIGALSPIQNATIHTKNHKITALSEFELSFNIRDDLYVKFHLEPNHDILASDASISYLAPDGSISRKEAVNRLDHKVFKGTAWVQRPRAGEDKWVQVGWARAMVKKDGKDPIFEGAFAVHQDHHHIEGSKNYLRTRHRLDPDIEALNDGKEYMVVWRDSDILSAPEGLKHQELRRDVDEVAGCGADGLSFNLSPDHPIYAGMLKPLQKRTYGMMDFSNIFRRQIDTTTFGNGAVTDLASTVGQTEGCPSTRKVALVGVATDCTYTDSFDTPEEARQNIIDQMNKASALWERTFQISLGLQNITLSEAECPGTPAEATEWNQACSSSVDIQARLNMFSAWRGLQNDGNSHWTLLSTCNTGSAVGLAWLGQACVSSAFTTNQSFTGDGSTGGEDNSETVAGANVVVRTNGASEWQVIAHETGHTFGAVHDCTAQACADENYVQAQQCCPLSANSCDAGERYIMNPSTSQGITDFSPCSVGNICNAMLRRTVNTDCLSENRDVTTITGQQCGNGIVEPGEDCDCGGTEGCSDDPCCNPDTCTYTEGSVCDDANEDCCNQCQFSSQGTVCRSSTGECDPQEVCPGDGGSCPSDQTQQDGESCGDGLQCAAGQCTSRDQQCKAAMGSYTEGNDTHSCDSQGCIISCASPEFGPNVCYGLQQNFLDGTECGGGGHCDNVSTKSLSYPFTQTKN